MLDNPQNISRITTGEQAGQPSNFHHDPVNINFRKLFIPFHVVTATNDMLLY